MSSILLGKSDTAAWLAGVFAVLVVLTTCTNLRISGLPLGPGELGLLVFMVVAFYWRRHRLVPVAMQFRPLFYFWGMYLLIILCAGGLSFLQHRLSSHAVHDVLAFGFSISVGFMALVLASEDVRAGRVMEVGIPLVALFVAMAAFLLLVADHLNGGSTYSAYFRANQWWWHRFNGWAQDPNQWGFLLMVACMLGLLGLRGRMRFWVFGIGLWLLLEVRSDAAIAGMLGFVVTLLGLALFRVPSARRSATLALVLLVLAVAVFKTVGERYSPSLVLRAVGAVASVEAAPAVVLDKRPEMTGNPVYIGYRVNKLDERLAIWKNTLSAWTLSPVIGLGPGAYSGLTGPLQGMEAHNLMLQMLVNAGVLGIMAALLLLGWLLRRLWRSPEGALWIAVVAGILVQGLGQYMLRHPLFWAVVALTTWKAMQDNGASAKQVSPATKADEERECQGF